MSQNFFKSKWNKLVGIEGDYVDNPNDSGGKTRWGVTEKVARGYGYKGDMRALPIELAYTIAKAEYWDKLRLDNVAALSPAIASELFDTGYNMGIARAGEFLQRCLNVLNRRGQMYADLKVDGKIGPTTFSALARYLKVRKQDGEKVLLRALNALQGAFYIQLAEVREKDEDFVFGWFLHRVV